VIVIDTETTGLIKSTLIPLSHQPHIIELAAVKLNEQLEQVDTLSFRCNPGTNMGALPGSPDIMIRDESLKDEPPFSNFVEPVVDFFLGERIMAAHNCAFDRDMLSVEMRRLNRLTRFPWPPVNICTVEATFHLEGHRLHQHELYKIATGRDLPQKHRALDDVLALVEIIRWLREQKLV
jgi:DNA polymerase-3 subunit epsilon